MINDSMLERINQDLIKYFLNSETLDFDLLKNFNAEDPKLCNTEIIRLLRNQKSINLALQGLGIDILLEEFSVEPSAINIIGKSLAIHHSILPISLKNDTLVIAVFDPFNFELIEKLKMQLNVSIVLKLTDFCTIKSALKNLSPAILPIENLDLEFEQPSRSSFAIKPESLTIKPERISLDTLLDNLIKDAVLNRASDIHFEQYESCLNIRIRVDGRLQQFRRIDGMLAHAIIANIKIRSRAKIDETRLPQDKRIRVKIERNHYDLRISIIPTIFGENIAIRIFDQENNDFKLNNIGLFDDQIDLLKNMIQADNGLILLCGPTGCGKTTTLYTLLNEISSPLKKVITIEDPIEYRLDGINQVAVNDEIGLSFASILRSVLRQSPNVIMVGEIRDAETAELAIQASLTGHLVFSTIHCEDSVGAITRLLDFRISEYLIKTCLRGSISQKLVRRPCPYCATVRELSDLERSLFHFSNEKFNEDELKVSENFKISANSGCEKCSNRGYKGRTAVFDFLVNNRQCGNSKNSKKVVFENFCHVSSFLENTKKHLRMNSILLDDAKKIFLQSAVHTYFRRP